MRSQRVIFNCSFFLNTNVLETGLPISLSVLLAPIVITFWQCRELSRLLTAADRDRCRVAKAFKPLELPSWSTTCSSVSYHSMSQSNYCLS